MKHKNLLAFLMCAVLLSALVMPVSADMGPKDSVNVGFVNMPDEICYGTLLSERESTGPQSVWDGNEEHIYNYDLDIGIWRAFAEYEDADGYYFLQCAWEITSDEGITWNYYPPSRFKILLYFPESGTFAVSGIYEQYAFDTYYTVDMDGFEIGSVEYDDEKSTDERIEAYRAYNYRREIIALVIRIVLTVAVELLIALCFALTEKRQLLLLTSVNAVTQIILNVLLNVIDFRSGPWAFIAYYILLEPLVIAIEAFVYARYMPRLTEAKKKKWVYVVYALTANIASFAFGLYLAEQLPNIF